VSTLFCRCWILVCSPSQVRRSNTRPHVEPDVDRPFSTRWSTPCAMKRCIIRCHVVEDFWSYRAVFGPNTLFCNWNFRTPAWVNNVIGLHESCLGQLPWDRFTGRVPFTEGFLSSGYQLGFSALLISLEFFPHTCNNSSKVVNDVLVGLCFGNYYRESL
jgi:hypothetical protein